MTAIFWAAAIVVFAVIEAVTVGLTSIWFAIGSLASLLVTFLNAPLWLQIAVFIVVSALMVAFTRPLAVKYLNNKKQPTNADRLMTMVGVVTYPIDNVLARGLVKIDGKEWTARSMSGEPISIGEVVRPVMIDGVKLVVVPVHEEEPAVQQ